jgi:hydroxypyruvate isomerase
MPRFAANLHYLFTEVAFLDRFAAAAEAGFRGVEFQVPYDYPGVELRARLEAHALTMVLFDAPMGDWQAGDRGLAAVPGREAEFRASLPHAAQYASDLHCDLVHVMAGVVGAGVDYAAAEQVYVANLRHAARFFKPHGVRVVIEPINRRLGVVQGAAAYTTEGMHGYFLNHSDQARRVIEQVDSDNLFLHLDVYHMQILEGHLTDTIRANIDRLRHVQIAGVPGRHEPSVGEIHYPYLFDLLDELHFAGWVGCEYRPLGRTAEGLGWATRYGIGMPGVASSAG